MFGKHREKFVLVALSKKVFLKSGVWTDFSLQPRVQVRTRYVSDRNFPKLADDLINSYNEQSPFPAEPMGTVFAYQKEIHTQASGDETVVDYQGVDEDTVDFTYVCSGSKVRSAHGTMAVWLQGEAGDYACPGVAKLSTRDTAMRKQLCKEAG